MKKDQFIEWLKVNTTNADRAINSITSRINRIEKAYGDLDKLKKSKFEQILSDFEYNSSDFSMGIMPKHKVRLNGNYYDGTSSLKKDLKLYYDYRFCNNDSYRLFLIHFGIKEKDFFDYGIKSLIFVDPNDAFDQMKQLIDTLENGNQTLFIRSYGRNGAGTHVFLKLYKDLFPKCDIQVDKSNNTKPKQIMQQYKGVRIGTNSTNGNTYNYILSHVFGMTKNPLFFMGAFNYCLCPRIYDPFTGKECSLRWNEDFSGKLQNRVKKDYKKTLELVKSFIANNNIINKIDSYCAKHNISKKEIQDIKLNWSISI